jgi:uncharacterized phage protein (TIGR01671 family)
MNRIIDFKAWDKKKEKMVNVHGLNGLEKDDSDPFKYITCSEGVIQWKDIILLQFTGLLDKNGKEIFEGDILKIYYEGNQRSYLKEVKWLNDAINKGRWDALDNCAYTSCEVVGNIFENPELLAEINNN